MRRLHRSTQSSIALPPSSSSPLSLMSTPTFLQSSTAQFGASRGVHPSHIFSGSDSVGESMTAALRLHLRDEANQGVEVKGMSGQVLLYPAARLPFDTKAVADCLDYYLECKRNFNQLRFWHILLRFALSSAGRATIFPINISGPSDLRNRSPEVFSPIVLACGFDPLRDVIKSGTCGKFERIQAILSTGHTSRA